MGFSPLLDVPPIPRPLPPARGARDQTRRVPKDPAVEMDGLIARLGEHWGTSRRVLIDLDGFERYRPGGVHPVQYFVERAGAVGLIVAVVASTRSTGEYRSTVRAWGLSGDRLVLRLHLDDYRASDAGAAAYSELVDDVQAGSGISDLVIDLGRLDPARPPNPAAVANEIMQIQACRPVRSMALASTSLPDFATLSRGEFRRSAREDWKLWQAVCERVEVPLAFADYGITGPRRDSDEPVHGPAAHLRYSHDDTVYIWKGQAPKSDEAVERGLSYPELCAKLLEYRANGRRIFRGRQFSAGDDAIWEKGIGSARPGGPSQWVEYATGHHLKEVITQLQAAP